MPGADNKGGCLVSHAQVGLQSLTLHNVGCSVRACQAVGELLRSAEELRTLHLLNNMSDDEGAAAIGQASCCSPHPAITPAAVCAPLPIPSQPSIVQLAIAMCWCLTPVSRSLLHGWGPLRRVLIAVNGSILAGMVLA